MIYNRQADGTFKAELDIPRIQDVQSGEYRPVTQADVDGLLRLSRAFSILVKAFEEVREGFLTGSFELKD